MARTNAGDRNDTPQQKKFEAKTGKDSDNALGGVEGHEAQQVQTPQGSGEPNQNRVKAPSGYDQDTWTLAEIAWRNQNGGSGLTDDARDEQIKGFYQQIVDNNEQTRKWEGK